MVSFRMSEGNNRARNGFSKITSFSAIGSLSTDGAAEKKKAQQFSEPCAKAVDLDCCMYKIFRY